jgi:hypothetical protein
VARVEKRIDPKTLSDDDLVERWKAWLEHTKRDAYEYYAFRFRVENVNKMFVENEALHTAGGASFFDCLKELYKTYCLASIRRELEGGAYENLISFLHELETFSERVLTRKRYVSMYKSTLAELGVPDDHFDQVRGATCKLPRTSADEDYISSSSVRLDRERLLRFAKSVVKLANWQILHRTSATPPTVTWGDVQRTMNRIFDTYARYNLLINGSVFVSRYPEPQYDWGQPFTIPWMPEGFTSWEKPDEPDDIS